MLRRYVAAKAEVHVLEAGHFALDEAAGEIAKLMRGLLGRLPDVLAIRNCPKQ